MPTVFRFQVNQSVKWLYFNALYSVRFQVNRIQIYYFWHRLPYERHDNIDSMLVNLTGSLIIGAYYLLSNHECILFTL